MLGWGLGPGIPEVSLFTTVGIIFPTCADGGESVRRSRLSGFGLSRFNSISILGFTTTARRHDTSHTSPHHPLSSLARQAARRRRRFPFYFCIHPSAVWFGRLIPRIPFPTGSDRVGSGRVGVFDIFGDLGWDWAGLILLGISRRLGSHGRGRFFLFGFLEP